MSNPDEHDIIDITAATESLVDFVIVAPPRSGSTFVMRLLDTHPDIRCAEELFGVQVLTIPKLERFPYFLTLKTHPENIRIVRMFKSTWNQLINKVNLQLQARRNANPIGYVRAIRHRNSQYRYFGFKLITSHHYGIKLLPELNPRRLITIRRRNIVKQAISLELADQSNEWQAFTKGKHYSSIYLDPQRLMRWINGILEGNKTTEHIIATMNCKHIEIIYEDFFEHIPAVLHKFSEFFNVDVQGFDPTAVGIYKITDRNLRNVITNFDEIYHCLDNDEYKKMLLDTNT
jgi:hypothetical protein